ncbi:MAG TPA: AsmA-like C-terminal region-containing protein, partial [Thermogutta sp.]|nr:AsmA-like C-terminal region-containing protein [Thermogutta sp.]
VDGTFIYENGTILVNDFQAFRGNTELRANVTCTLLPGGGWQLVFSNLWVDRLVADRSLLLALPEKLSRSFARLNIQGPLAIRGEFTIGRCGASDNGQEQQTATLGEPQNLSSLSSAWNVVVTLVQNDLGAAIPIRNINGRIFLRGEYRNGHLFSLGHFDLDALTVQGLPLFRFYGPFSLDNEILFLGDYQNRFPGPEQGSSVPAARYVTAELFGGQIMGGGWIRMSPEFSFDLAGSLVAADFQQILRQYHHNDGVNARGKVDVTVRIRGKGDDVQGLSGYGNFQFREADIYELPIMLALLKLFDLRRPDATTAFTESTGSFRIAGRHIYLDSNTFRGEMFHLTGQGEMDFDRNVR